MAPRDDATADIRFYYGIGAFMIVVYGGAIAAAVLLDLAVVDRRLVPLTVGFLLFMLVYFVSISVQRLEPSDA
ncbi:hypothetical protein D8Y22_16350 [Salinadaptatus halalkaliphilus]|uniref:Uncharacterized protein n=1 Tax=Salinadaptatus halalkaliphilus TaxID=2419781 RepID=A0A4S3TIV5_9EURY|nr:hypothetical protein [Salinadaptatus halalkaliphilus]THE63892.1 hypothetical protein D8Y22_16350 [Salinadaptatus halalkaliphilus]